MKLKGGGLVSKISHKLSSEFHLKDFANQGFWLVDLLNRCSGSSVEADFLRVYRYMSICHDRERSMKRLLEIFEGVLGEKSRKMSEVREYVNANESLVLDDFLALLTRRRFIRRDFYRRSVKINCLIENEKSHFRYDRSETYAVFEYDVSDYEKSHWEYYDKIEPVESGGVDKIAKFLNEVLPPAQSLLLFFFINNATEGCLYTTEELDTLRAAVANIRRINLSAELIG